VKTFKEIQEKVLSMQEQKYIAVAVAQDEEVLKAIKGARECGLAEPILVGEEKAIREAAHNVGLNLKIKIPLR